MCRVAPLKPCVNIKLIQTPAHCHVKESPPKPLLASALGMHSMLFQCSVGHLLVLQSLRDLISWHETHQPQDHEKSVCVLLQLTIYHALRLHLSCYFYSVNCCKDPGKPRRVQQFTATILTRAANLVHFLTLRQHVLTDSNLGKKGFI